MPTNFKFKSALLAATAYAVLIPAAFAQETNSDSIPAEQSQPIILAQGGSGPVVTVGGVESVTVTARRREEMSQDVPVSLSVIGIEQIETTGTYNVGQIQLYTPA